MQAHLAALILRRGYLILSLYKDRNGHQLFLKVSLLRIHPQAHRNLTLTLLPLLQRRCCLSPCDRALPVSGGFSTYVSA